ncbi:MAG: type II toxin-antitoxin system VapC family toxin, partial [Candidatus Dormibacteraceae bacterium]
EKLIAPELMDLEILSAIRGWVLTGLWSASDGAILADRAEEIPILRYRHRVLLNRIWELRHTLTPYDASYVALAEMLKVDLLTSDGKMARASGSNCKIHLFSV